jgi:hypothetical protein
MKHDAELGLPAKHQLTKQKKRKGNFFAPNHPKKKEKTNLLLFLREQINKNPSQSISNVIFVLL